jgi:glutamate N-acetyltransferase / amino-acid N-acetyltransferase
MSTWEEHSQGLAAVSGFRSAGAVGGIKPSGKPDVAVIVGDGALVAAGCMTRNRAAAACVQRTRAILARATHRAVVINSGNANCCTGAQGVADDAAMAKAMTAGLGCEPESVFTCSTGVIGVPMPMEAVRQGIDTAVASLAEPRHSAAEAIRTTDLVSKEVALVNESGYAIAGIAKGSGMIHPNMATMLAFICTDATIDKHLLQELCSAAVYDSFNAISVDNDESTNDTCLVLASGRSGVEITGAEAIGTFAEGLARVMRDLAHRIVRDGEGATSFITVDVRGGRDATEADRVARSICDSMLVKTAIAGHDPNWGRIACAAGYSGADFSLEQLQIRLNNVLIFSDGQGHDDRRRPFRRPDGDVCSRRDLAASMRGGEVHIELDLGAGTGERRRWTSDLTHGYVSINADYTT